MTYDYSKLNCRIVERYGTRKEFGKAMGWSEHTISCKLTNKVAWKQADITKAVDLLGIEKNDIGIYFFKLKVQ